MMDKCQIGLRGVLTGCVTPSYGTIADVLAQLSLELWRTTSVLVSC